MNGAAEAGSALLSAATRLSSFLSRVVSSVIEDGVGFTFADPLGFGLLFPGEADVLGEVTAEEVGFKIPLTPTRGVPSVPPAVISKVGSE